MCGLFTLLSKLVEIRTAVAAYRLGVLAALELVVALLDASCNLAGYRIGEPEEGGDQVHGKDCGNGEAAYASDTHGLSQHGHVATDSECQRELCHDGCQGCQENWLEHYRI